MRRRTQSNSAHAAAGATGSPNVGNLLAWLHVEDRRYAPTSLRAAVHARHSAAAAETDEVVEHPGVSSPAIRRSRVDCVYAILGDPLATSLSVRWSCAPQRPKFGRPALDVIEPLFAPHTSDLGRGQRSKRQVYCTPPEHPLHPFVANFFFVQTRAAYSTELIPAHRRLALLFNLGDAIRVTGVAPTQYRAERGQVPCHLWK